MAMTRAGAGPLSTSTALSREIALDPSTGFPLLHQQASIFELLLAHVQLPHSVAEYGCGKKANLIIEQVHEIGIPIWALKRGLALEPDLSEATLAELDARRRPGALVVENPLYRLGDLNDPLLLRMLEAASARISTEGNLIHADEFTLHHAPWVQFVQARSHVYAILTFWDDVRHGTVDRVIDPTLERSEPFEVERIRELTHCSEALLFEAALLGRFRLSADYLTRAQAARIAELLPKGQTLETLDHAAHAALVRSLTHAAPESIGDPEVWTYANNMRSPGDPQQIAQDALTGQGDPLLALTRQLRQAREARDPAVDGLRAELERIADRIDVDGAIRRDAAWAEQALEPLATVAITMVSYRSLTLLAETLTHGRPVADSLTTVRGHIPLRGLGVRLRSRVDRLAAASEDPDGRGAAHALSPEYVRCVLEVIEQMNAAGLAVFIDRVGNVHGLMLDSKALDESRSGLRSIAELTRHAMLFVSHLDTVGSAGKYDGRLGIASGIEVAQVLAELRRYFDLRVQEPGSRVVLGVTAFIGEEMTFTGKGVSMPGSAAVAGRASIEQIDAMRDAQGVTFRERLIQMLRILRDRAREGDIRLENPFTSDEDEALLAACFEPRDFFTRHTYERHVEHGPVLSAHGVPMALVTTVMGILQEDITLVGPRAEEAALLLAYRLRDLTTEAALEGTRLTVGVVTATGERLTHESPPMALRVTLGGGAHHAGATPMHSRRDPLVALGRLYAALAEWCTRHSTRSRPLAPLVGDLTLTPGDARNVVPHAVSATLAVRGASFTERERRRVIKHLEGFATGALSQEQVDGGEGIEVLRLSPVGFVNAATSLTLSVDVRAPLRGTLDSVHDHVASLAASIAERCEVKAETSTRQRLPPQPLSETGQVLLIERSYGGGESPNEADLTADLTSGTILQLAVAVDALGRPSLDGVDLLALVREYLPNRWKRRLDELVSGAPHDTCNISARVLEG
jgi:acetylornithine deacetylase/succinyl-diaminopimelate desuccinylase-like protein